MTAGRVLPALLLAALVTTWPGRLAAQAIQRSMYVSVLTDAGVPVPGLGPSDFIVREDNVAREVLRVEPATDPMQVAVLVDTSQQARNDISHVRTALPPFLATLTGGAVKSDVAIIAFGERPTTFADYTTNKAALQKGVDRIWSQQGAGAYLLDAIAEISTGFKKKESPRPVIVAIAAEGGEYSYRQHEQVLETLTGGGAALYAIMLGTPSSSMSQESISRNVVLDRGPLNSGGRRDQLLSPMALGEKLKQLGDQLTHMYKVTYARPQSLIPPEKVTVAATGAGRTARGTLMKDDKGRR
jgi:hypothetical protein